MALFRPIVDAYGDCQYEYVAITANVARLRTLEPWTRTMDNLWRLAHIEDGNSALPILYHLGVQAGRNFAQEVGHTWLSFLSKWNEAMQELLKNIGILLPFFA